MSIQEAASQFNRWKMHPSQMVRELFNVEPDPWQLEVLEAFPHKQRIAMCASKGPGKSAVESWLAWNFLLTRPYPKIAATSVTGANLADGFWSECAKWQQMCPLLRDNFTWTKMRIFLNASPETWWMSARPWSKTADTNEQGNTLAGLHADYILFILDESGSIPDAVAASAEAALSSCIEGHIIQAGNPTDISGMLYKACVRDKALWHVVRINSDPDSPMRSPRVSAEWARQQIQMYGRDNPWILVNVFGEFPPAAFNALIGIDEVEASMKRVYHDCDYGYAAKVLGIDVARSGADASVIFPRQGLQAFTPLQYRNVNGTEGANLTARKWRDWGADVCFIDDTGGFGASWIDNLQRLGYSPIGVHFSEKASNPRYANKRTEMIFECVEWIKGGGSLPNVPELTASLTETTYTFKGDALIIEPKELIKARLGYSPDFFDALALGFAQPALRASAQHSNVNLHQSSVGFDACSLSRFKQEIGGKQRQNGDGYTSGYNPDYRKMF
jgi:hypothetical protein